MKVSLHHDPNLIPILTPGTISTLQLIDLTSLPSDYSLRMKELGIPVPISNPIFSRFLEPQNFLLPQNFPVLHLQFPLKTIQIRGHITVKLPLNTTQPAFHPPL